MDTITRELKNNYKEIEKLADLSRNWAEEGTLNKRAEWLERAKDYEIAASHLHAAIEQFKKAHREL